MGPYDELVAWLRGEVSPPALSHAALGEARRHGVHLLVAERGRSSEGAFVDGFDQLFVELRAAAVNARVRADELRRVTEALTAHGLPALLFKGAALAYSIYPYPYVRPSVDSDILIRSIDRDVVLETLVRLGYRPETQVTGDLISSQYCLTHRRGPVAHTIDVHWKLVNPLAYADRLTFDALWSNAVAVPLLSSAARMPSPGDHLLISSLHRLAHHQNWGYLLWLYDIHLLVRAMDQRQRDLALARARSCGLENACRIGLEMAQAAFGGIDREFIEAFDVATESGALANAFLSPDASRAALLLEDLRALGGLRSRLRLVHQHLFPPAAYMRSAYPGIPRPLAYALRVVRGAPKWFVSRRPPPER